MHTNEPRSAALPPVAAMSTEASQRPSPLGALHHLGPLDSIHNQLCDLLRLLNAQLVTFRGLAIQDGDVDGLRAAASVGATAIRRRV